MTLKINCFIRGVDVDFVVAIIEHWICDNGGLNHRSKLCGVHCPISGFRNIFTRLLNLFAGVLNGFARSAHILFGVLFHTGTRVSTASGNKKSDKRRGVASDVKMSIALANSGDLQIELIQQRNDAPSLYKEFLDAGFEGLQHMSYWTHDYQGLYDKALSLGYVVGHEGAIGGEKGRFAYFDTQTHPGTIVEISDISGPKGAMFAHIRKVAADWDGADPIRVVG